MTLNTEARMVPIPCIVVSNDFPAQWLVRMSEPDDTWYAVPCVEGGWEQRKAIVMLDLYDPQYIDSEVATAAIRYCQIPKDAVRITSFLLSDRQGERDET